MEYLYQQTGNVLQDYKLAIEELETTEVVIEEGEGYAELEEFQDITVPTVDTERTPASSQASVSAAASPTPPATSSMSSISVVPHSSVTSHVSSSSTSSQFVVPLSPAKSPVTSSTSSGSEVPLSPVTSPVNLQSKPSLSPVAHSCKFYQITHRGFRICCQTNSKCTIERHKYKFKLNIYLFHVVPVDQLSAETSEENISHDVRAQFLF